MSKKEIFRKVLEEVRDNLEKNPSLSFAEITERVMNKHRIPTTEDTRAGYKFAISERLKKEGRKEPSSQKSEQTEESPEMFSEKIMHKIRIGAKEMQTRDSIEEGIIEGEISKENLIDPSFRYEGKKPKDLGFGPPR